MRLFPFSAVLGQERLKLALLLCAIDPGIGGVLVRGPRGVAKTTLARAFSELLPGRFVELPLGATEERVTGSLDLGKAFGQGEVAFAPGLLARAHDGVLYVDEVNLLPDALVDLLLDASASGQNVIERDGVSHVHAARFVLIGTMNPEEGELRPQLCDRFGLAVAATNVLTPEERTQVVLRRLEFEQDPERFGARYADEQQALVERCRAARQRLVELPFAGPGVARAAALCHAAGVDGVRADLAMLRAARAHAAWRERSEISSSDVDAVAELALEHRRRGPAPGGGGAGGRNGSSGGARSGSRGDRGPSREPGSSLAQDPTRAGSGSSADQADAAESGGGCPATPAGDARGVAGGRGADADADAEGVDEPESGAGAAARQGGAGRGPALEPVAVRSAEPPVLPRWFLEPASRRRGSRPSAERLPATRPPPTRRRRGCGELGEGAVDWFATLLQPSVLQRPLQPSLMQSSLMQPSLQQPSRATEPSARGTLPQGSQRSRFELLRRPRRLAAAGRWVIAIDCSASMLQSGALGVAKAVARALASRAANASAELALVSFGGADASVHGPAAAGAAAIERAIVALGAAGGTPLRRAVELGLELADRAGSGKVERRLSIFTDGRTRETLDDLASLHPAVDVSVIDCERGTLRLGRARRIAAALGAAYVHIESLAAFDALGARLQAPPRG